jgi:protein-tyrosine phosphatase
VKKDIKLNHESEGSDNLATNYGIKIVYAPMPPSNMLDSLGQPKREEYFRVINEIKKSLAKGEGVLVHCTHGQDRTGIVMGGVDLYIFHKTKKEAWDNMIKHGFHVEFIGLDSFWESLPSY